MRTELRLRAAIWLTLVVIVAAPLVWIDTSHSGVEEEIVNLRKELAGIKKDIAEIKKAIDEKYSRYWPYEREPLSF